MTREVFIAQVEREQEALRGFLLALCCGNKSDADDLFRSWLFKIAHNTFLNHKASCRTMESIDEARMLIGGNEADSSFEHQDLYLALRTLPPKERSAITLFYLNGYSIKEIASITDASQDAIKQQLSRGRDKLKAKLQL